MNGRIGFFTIIFTLLVGIQLPMAQNLIWVTVEAEAPVVAGDTKKARGQALKTAERLAVAEALATGISVETLLVNLRLSGSIVGAIPFGKVVEKEILEEGPVKSKNAESASKDMHYRIRLKAGVVRESGMKDSSFYLDAAINKQVFNDGDALQITIRSTKKCYFAIFNILDDNKIIRLLPNYLSRKNFLETNENYIFPGITDRHKGLKLRIHMPENKKKVTESIYILALDQPFELNSINVQEGIFGVFNGQTAFMKDLIQEVVSIPLEKRAEALMQYEIRKN